MGWGCRRRPRRSGPAHLCSSQAVCSPLGLIGGSTPPWLGSSSLPLGGGCAASQAAGPPAWGLAKDLRSGHCSQEDW